MESRGGETGGPTLDEFLDDYKRAGYPGSFDILDSGQVQCQTCGSTAEAARFRLLSLRRVEGVSDPDDMAAVGALECPYCSARGTASLCYGPRCPPGHAEALRGLQDDRRSHRSSLRAEAGEPSLVSDSGWIEHDDRT